MKNSHKTSSQAKTAYQTLRNFILNGEFSQGEPLVETDLSDKLNMSRTPIREALQKLQDDGLVTRVRNKGFFVKVISREDIKQSYEALEALEGMICYLLAGCMPEDGLKKLESAVNTMEIALKENDIDKWANADTEFHNAICDYSQNNIIISTMEKLNIFVRSVREIISKYSIDKNSSTKAHRLTYEYIKDGDADKARETMQQHISAVRQQFIKIL
jgi:DNA-binding GntR family transcriptional regulator